MVGWHHRLNGHKFEQTLGDGEGQGSLPCCSPWGRKESERLSDLTVNITIVRTMPLQSSKKLQVGCKLFFH